MDEGKKSLFDSNSSLFWARWEGCESPKNDGGGGPAGVNEGADEGGGSAGVVEGLEIKLFDFESWPLAILDRESGVDGGDDENGTTKPDMAEGICVEPKRQTVIQVESNKKECVESTASRLLTS